MFRTLACLVLAAATSACGSKPAPATTPAAAPIATPTPTPAPTPASPKLGLDLANAWTSEQMQPILDKTQRGRLDPDLSHLTVGERAAVAKLLEVGAIMQELYEDQRHIDAPAARALLASLDKSPRNQQLHDLYRLFQGPIASTLDQQLVTFLGTRPPAPSTTMYPWGIEAAEIDAFVKAHPERRDALLAPRTVVRRAEAAALDADLATLAQYPVLDTLHPGLRAELKALRAQPAGLYAVPYSVAFADRLLRAHALLNEAASLVAKDDHELAGYLRNRSRDLLSDDYESGDAAWITGSFKNLNVQVGSYESYDDELYGVKTYFGFTLMARRPATSVALSTALGHLQALENALPYKQLRRVAARIPLDVYDVIADFGQTRGGNTTSILPNEHHLIQRYGKTVQLRANILTDDELFEHPGAIWRAVMTPAQADDLTGEAMLQRTLWHETGHFVGIEHTKAHDALGPDAEMLEELKGDLFAVFSARMLRERGYYDDAALRALYAAGVQRLLRASKPKRSQTYYTMWLMQLNFLMEKRAVRFDAKSGLSIDYSRYHDAAKDMLGRVLELQRTANKPAIDKFVERYTTWDEAVHGAIGARIRSAHRYRYQLFRYAALGE
jgi:hypothetical protein